MGALSQPKVGLLQVPWEIWPMFTGKPSPLCVLQKTSDLGVLVKASPRLGTLVAFKALHPSVKN